MLDDIIKKIDGRRAEYSCMKVVIISTKKICQVDLTRPLNTDVDVEEDAAIAMIGKLTESYRFEIDDTTEELKK